MMLLPLGLYAQELSVQDYLESPIVALVEPLSIQSNNQYKANVPQGNVIELKVLKSLKGNLLGNVLVFEEQLFKEVPSHFVLHKFLLVFLNKIPNYSSYQVLKEKGVEYIPAHKSGAVLEDVEAQEEYQTLLKSPELISKLSYELLLKSKSSRIQEDIAAYYKKNNPSLSDDHLSELTARVLQKDFSEKAKIFLADYFTRSPQNKKDSLLKQFICVKPDELCLKVVSSLEQNGLGLNTQQYESVLKDLDENLKAKLLSLLAQFQRKDLSNQYTLALENFQSQENKSQILRSLGSVKNNIAENLCLKYTNKKEATLVRLSAISCLGDLKSEKSLPLLEKTLQQYDPAQISVVASALDRIGSPKALKLLNKYYQKGHHGNWELAEPKHFLP